MKNLSIKINRNKISTILIGENLINKLDQLIELNNYSSIYIITDSNVGKIYLKEVVNILKNSYKKNIFSFTFSAGEKNKNLKTVAEIYKDLVNKKIDRKALIINLGGGVVTDLGGFVAATFLRVIPSVNISTSIEGMVDASIGGKVGVNFNQYKNYIGSFHQPQTVIVDIDTLKTLSQRNLIAGFGEIIKHGLIQNKTYFDFVVSKKPVDFSNEELISIIETSCKIKANIVEKDETEKNLRQLLNFGHTAGHAIESLSLKTNNPLLHGEAVAIGIVIVSKISELLKMISSNDFETIQKALKNTGLPTSIPSSISIPEILNMIKKDKKSDNKKVKWVLLKEIGKGIINCDVDETIVQKALQYCY